jgi:prostaglandin-H2 D-isomerase / glutathione transferase
MKLYYFDIAGKGDCIRLLCAHAEIPLEDVRIPLANREIFDKLKSDGKLPFGQLPALEIKGDANLITQSASIMRYIGKISGAYPTCPVKAALVDGIIDEETDLTTGLSVSRYRGIQHASLIRVIYLLDDAESFPEMYNAQLSHLHDS